MGERERERERERADRLQSTSVHSSPQYTTDNRLETRESQLSSVHIFPSVGCGSPGNTGTD